MHQKSGAENDEKGTRGGGMHMGDKTGQKAYWKELSVCFECFLLVRKVKKHSDF